MASKSVYPSTHTQNTKRKKKVHRVAGQVQDKYARETHCGPASCLDVPL